MSLPDVALARPGELSECLELLKMPGARVIAGGTDLLVELKAARRAPQTLIDICGIPALSDCVFSPERIMIGAACTMAQLASEARLPRAICEAAGSVGSPQVRNMATLGGNVCTALPSADTVPALLLLDAECTIANSDGGRILPLRELLLAPRKTALQPGDLLFGFAFPAPPADFLSCYEKQGRRKSLDLAQAGVACGLRLAADGTIAEARIAVTAAAPVPYRAGAAEVYLKGKNPEEAVFAAAADMAAAAARPIDDLRASKDYRRALVRSLTLRGLLRLYREVVA